MDDERLISLIQKYPLIYNKRLADFRNKPKKAKAWQYIANAMDTSEEQCVRRWTSLRDKYTKVSRERELPSGSGAADDNGWYLYESMNFLKEHVKPRATRGNVTSSSSNSRSTSPQFTEYSFDCEYLYDEEPIVEAEIPATPGTQTTPATPGTQTTPATPGTQTTPATSGTQITPLGKNKRKRPSDDPLDQCMMSALTAFEKRCKTSTPSASKNEAVEGFKIMVGGLIEQFPISMQARVMQKVLAVITEEQTNLL